MGAERGQFDPPPNSALNDSGVARRDGTLDNVSVSSASGKSVKELSAGYLNGQVGVTTVGEIRAMGGTITQPPR